jgi:hypothetical protein
MVSNKLRILGSVVLLIIAAALIYSAVYFGISNQSLPTPQATQTRQTPVSNDVIVNLFTTLWYRGVVVNIITGFLLIVYAITNLFVK